MSAYESSGLTQAAFCEEWGLKLPTLVSWLQKHRESQDSGRICDFAEVNLPELTVPCDNAGLVAEGQPWGYELTVARMITLKISSGINIEDLTTLIVSLKKAC